MRVIDEDMLESFRTAGACEWCLTSGPTEPHHIFARGMGGGGRLDIRINLAALCRRCHQAHHDGNHPLRFDLLAIVAAREGLLQSEIEAEIHRLRRLPKGSTYGGTKKRRRCRKAGSPDQPGNVCPAKTRGKSRRGKPRLAAREDGWTNFL